MKGSLLKRKYYCNKIKMSHKYVASYIRHHSSKQSQRFCFFLICLFTIPVCRLSKRASAVRLRLCFCFIGWLSRCPGLNRCSCGLGCNGPYSLLVRASYFISCSVHARFASVLPIDCKWRWGCRYFWTFRISMFCIEAIKLIIR